MEEYREAEPDASILSESGTKVLSSVDALAWAADGQNSSEFGLAQGRHSSFLIARAIEHLLLGRKLLPVLKTHRSE